MNKNNKMSRSYNSIKNILFGGLGHIVSLTLEFIVRTVFIYKLSQEYLGINGLLVSILSVLSISELGIGTAITFALYEPIAKSDFDKISQLMCLYKKCYRFIGLAVLIIGLAIIPIVPMIVDEPSIDIDITIIYLLFLGESCSSYLFFSYKNAFLIANQEVHIVSFVKMIVQILKAILRILILVFLNQNKNFCFYLYSMVGILCTIVTNIIISTIVDKLYPYVNDFRGELDKREKQKIFKNVVALSLDKISYVMNSSADNIIITKFVGLIANGIYSNYSLIVSSITTGIGIISTSLVAGIGNLNAIETKAKKEDFFNKLRFFYAWLYGELYIGMYCLINPFIAFIWGESNLLSQITVFAILLNFLTSGLIGALVDYRDACGVYWENRFVPLICAGLNILLSLLGAGLFNMGIMGILLATTVSRTIVVFPYYSKVIFNKIFEKSAKVYMVTTIVIAISIIIGGNIMLYICSLVTSSGIKGLIIKFILCAFLPNMVICLAFFKNKNFSYWVKKILSIIRRKTVEKC